MENVVYKKTRNKFQIELTTRLALDIKSGLEERLADSKLLSVGCYG